MDSQMSIFVKQKPIVFIILILGLFINVSCRSTINNPLKENQSSQYKQIDTISRGEPDQRGIITYDTYQILIANGSETIGQIATRLGINKEKLALYNGLIPNYRPRAEEMIALPEDQFISSSGWSTEITSAAIESVPAKDRKLSSANNPLRHRIKKGDTVYSLARKYKVSVNSIATWNGLGPDLEIKTGREIIIPAAASSVSKTKKLSITSAEEPSEDKIKIEKTVPRVKSVDASNSLEQFEDVKDNNVLPEAKVISVKPFIAPVDGKIVSFYSQDKGSQNNNGIDYSTEIGATVKAVSNGTVVLISDIVGGEGKIVLIRHNVELITIYGRLTNVLVVKGDQVIQGQKIGGVIQEAGTENGLMHFEVRRGMQSIDPETMVR